MTDKTINILYFINKKELNADELALYMQKIPSRMHDEAKRYRRWQDRQSYLFGKLLLLEGLKRYHYPIDCLNNILYGKFGRPYIDDQVDFNISHSGKYIVCALIHHGRIGIDIEKVKTINIFDFKDYLDPAQFQKILKSDNPYEAFFKYWTINESVIKADGRGLSIPLSKVSINRKRASLMKKLWFIGKIKIDKHYTCHLAVDKGYGNISVRELKTSNFL